MEPPAHTRSVNINKQKQKVGQSQFVKVGKKPRDWIDPDTSRRIQRILTYLRSQVYFKLNFARRLRQNFFGSQESRGPFLQAISLSNPAV